MKEEKVLTAHYEGKGKSERLVFRDADWVSILRLPVHMQHAYTMKETNKPIRGRLIKKDSQSLVSYKKFIYDKRKCVIINYKIEPESSWKAVIESVGDCKWKILSMSKVR